MKTLITGGSKGLGLHLAREFNAISCSRTSGWDTTKQADVESIAEMSLEFEVFINNAFVAFDGMNDINFSQTNMYAAVYAAWKRSGKKGYIFNIGSSGNKTIELPENYRIAKAALEHASKQGTHAFRHNEVPFKTTLLSLDRLDTESAWKRAVWTGNGINLEDVSNAVKYCLGTGGNTCVEEMTLFCNYNFKA